MFEREQTLYEDPEPLNESYQPNEIRERNEVIGTYQRALQPVIDGTPLSNIFLYGKTGTGKTAVTRYMLRHLEEDAGEYDDIKLTTAWVDCENLTSSYQVAVQLVNWFRGERGAEYISDTGRSQQKVFELLYDEMDRTGGTIVIVLDEIDNIGHSDDILYSLPRARAKGNVEKARPMFIGISNDLRFRENLAQEVKDTLAETEILFTPYDADQLRAILAPRADRALREDVLERDVVPMCAGFAANDTGSARQAIRLLKVATQLTLEAEDDVVTTDHVDEAREELQRSQLREGMKELTTQGHAVLCALAYERATGNTPVRSRHIYDRYEHICERASPTINVVTERRVRDHLSDIRMLGLVEVTERNEGKRGRYHEYEIDVPLSAVLSVLEVPQFEEITAEIRGLASEHGQLPSDDEDNNETTTRRVTDYTD